MIIHKRYFVLLLLSLFFSAAYSQSRSLEFYINEGLKNSALLKDIQNQRNITSVDSLLVKASVKPLVEAKSQLLYAPSYRNFGYDEVITDGGNYQAVAAVSQNIFNRKGIENRYRSLSVKNQSLNNTAKISVADLKKAIIGQYLFSLSDFIELTFNQSFLTLMKNENDVIRRCVANGLYNQTDYLAMLVETQGQEVIIKQLKNKYKVDLSLLNQLCGIEDTAFYELESPGIEPAGKADISLFPAYRQFGTDSLNLVNEKNAIDIRYKPKVSWFADAGVLTSTPLNFYRHFGYSAGLSLTVPIYDGRQRDLEKKKLDFSENTRSYYANNYRKQYNLLYLQFEGELNGLKDVDQQLEKQLGSSKQLVNELKAKLETGLIQITDYLNAMKNLRNINHSLNMVKIQMFELINEINYLSTQ